MNIGPDTPSPGYPTGDPTADRIAAAPLPTAATLRRRSSLPVQLWRFTVINLKMLRMVSKSH